MTISPIFHNARPEGELPPQESAAFDLLDTLGIDYDRVSHDAAFNMELCADVSAVLGVSVCKNLFLCNRQQTVFYLLMMPGDKKFRTKDLSSQLGCARLSFADERFLLEYLDIHPGSVSIMGLMNDKTHAVQLLVDRELLKDAFIGCHPCVNTSSMRIAREDLFGKFLEAVGHDYRIVDLPGDEP